MTLGEVQRRLIDGDWIALTRGVYVCAGTPMSHRVWCWAAVLAVGPPVALARRSAAVALRLDRAPDLYDDDPADVVVPRPRRADDVVGVAHVRRLVAHRFQVVRTRDGLPVTTPALTLRELGAVLPRDWLRDMTQHAIRRRIVSWSSLAVELGRGLPGAAVLRNVLEEVAPGYQVVWEGRLHAALRDAGVDVEPQVEVTLAGGSRVFLDLGDRRLKLGVEVDGFVSHLDRFAADRERDRLLMLAGWLVIHVAAVEVANDLPRVVEHIVRLARVRGAALAQNMAQ